MLRSAHTVYLGFAWLSEQQKTKLTDSFLGSFAKLRKTTACLVLSVGPSGPPFCSHGTI